MSINIIDNISIDHKLAQNSDEMLLILPEKTDKEKNEALYPANTINILKLLKQKVETGIAYGNIENITYIENRDADWLCPTLYFSAALISAHPYIISIVINIISNYIYDIFNGKSENPTIDCSFIYYESKRHKKITYNGPVSGLKDITNRIKQQGADDQNDI